MILRVKKPHAKIAIAWLAPKEQPKDRPSARAPELDIVTLNNGTSLPLETHSV